MIYESQIFNCIIVYFNVSGVQYYLLHTLIYCIVYIVRAWTRVVCVYTCSEATVIRPYIPRDHAGELAWPWPCRSKLQGGGQYRSVSNKVVSGHACMGKLNIYGTNAHAAG